MVTRQRSTLQKQAIAEAFENARRPLTVPEVHAEALNLCPGLGVATVYRAVNRLVLNEWLKEVRLPDHPVRYERRSLGHHHHFHCEACERVLDIAAPCEGLATHIPDGFTVRRHELTFYGVCNECSA